MMLDCTKATDQRRLLEVELEAVGVRINQKKPDIQFKRKVCALFLEQGFAYMVSDWRWRYHNVRTLESSQLSQS